MKAVKIAVLSVALTPLAALVVAPVARAQSGDAYYELQLLRDEIRQMSGRIEELDHEVRRLKQRQQEDYMELDRRISPDAGDTDGEVGAVPAPGRSPGPATIPQPESRTDLPLVTSEPQVLVDASAAGATDPQADRQQYDDAYDLLRRRRMDDAAQAFQAYVDDNPQGRFVANAHYWLGEIYLLQNKLDDAKKAFSTVKDDFPSDQKAEDAAYKLARVHHLQGDDRRARAILEEVASGNSNTAQLARDYLRDNF